MWYHLNFNSEHLIVSNTVLKLSASTGAFDNLVGFVDRHYIKPSKLYLASYIVIY